MCFLKMSVAIYAILPTAREALAVTMAPPFLLQIGMTTKTLQHALRR